MQFPLNAACLAWRRLWRERDTAAEVPTSGERNPGAHSGSRCHPGELRAGRLCIFVVCRFYEPVFCCRCVVLTCRHLLSDRSKGEQRRGTADPRGPGPAGGPAQAAAGFRPPGLAPGPAGTHQPGRPRWSSGQVSRRRVFPHGRRSASVQ